MKNKYTALTIGPIYKTFLNVRKTREIWAASYMFSYLMKQVILNLESKGIEPGCFIVPFVNKKALEYKGVGIIPDRLIFESNSGDYQLLQDAISEAVKKFAGCISDNPAGVEDYLNDYLRFYSIEKELPDGANIIAEMFNHLDTLELQEIPVADENAAQLFLFSFFRKINKSPFFSENNFQKDDQANKNLRLIDVNGNVRFESVAEIATAELKNNPEVDYRNFVNTHLWKEVDGDIDSDQKFIESLEEKYESLFKTYHKYIAIIKADGDKIGKTIENLKGDASRLKNFSEGLLNWAFDCDEVVRSYGGVPIYIGGDDLLMFAPVSFNNKTILDMVDVIDASFKKAMSGFPEVSLSYGISITYYKYPMFEAVCKVDELLKQAKDFSGQRNAVCIRLLKHSGAVFETTFGKSDEVNTKEKLQDVVNCIGNLDKNKGKSFLNSVAYFLRENETLVKQIGKDKARVENFFANNFEGYKREKDLKALDGKKEKRKPKANYLKKVEELLTHTFEHLPNTEDVLPSVYSSLRIARFIKGMEDGK